MCKELLVIPVNRVVDMKIKVEKMEGQGGGEAQGVADPNKKRNSLVKSKHYKGRFEESVSAVISGQILKGQLQVCAHDHLSLNQR
jgi:hypothetical protein